MHFQVSCFIKDEIQLGLGKSYFTHLAFVADLLIRSGISEHFESGMCNIP